MFAHKVFAFVIRDFRVHLSYKLAFFLNILGVVSSILIFFFIDKLFGSKIVTHLAPYKVNYFSYVLVAMAFYSFMGLGLSNIANQIRGEQLMGTLEALLATPTGITTLLVSMGAWNIILASTDAVIYLLSGIFIFKIDLSHANLLSILMAMILTALSFTAMGIIAASFVIVFKRGEPISWFANTTFGLLGGVYFPITVLPGWLQKVSAFLPVTYAIRAVELATYKGLPPTALQHELGILLLFSLILLPFSAIIFWGAIKKAKLDGSLAHY